MRVSTLGAYQQGLASMQRMQSMSARTQRQISSGQRLLNPSDDPIAATRTLELRDSLARLEQYKRNANIATIRLQDEEVALKSVNDVLQRVRELALQANNATQSNETRALIAVEMRQHLDQLVQIANQEDGNGRFLFAGNADKTTPVTLSSGSYTYNGDQGQRQIRIGASRSIADADSGFDVFFQIRQGNGTFVVSQASANTGSGVVGGSSVVDPTLYDGAQYTVRFSDPVNYQILDSSSAVIGSGTFESGSSIGFQGIEFSVTGQPQAGDDFVVAPSTHQDVFSSIRDLIGTLESGVNNDATRALMQNGINSGLNNIDQAIENIMNVRTRVGSRLVAIESQGDANSGFALALQQTIGSLEDLDYAEALSRMSFELSVLEAAQKSFVRTQSLSLFNFF